MLVNHNSIIGVNSITANGDQLYFFKEDGTDAVFNLSGINVLNTSGVSTFAGLESTGDLVIGGNVSVGGTLTYEDVTNVDSVGLITARSGVQVKTGTATTALVVEGDARITGILSVGQGTITLDPTANQLTLGDTTMHQDSSTGDTILMRSGAYNPFRASKFLIDAVEVIDNSRVGKNFSKIGIGTDSPSELLHLQSGHTKQILKSTNLNTASYLLFDTQNITTADFLLGRIAGKWNGNDVAYIQFEAGADTTNKDDGVITFLTSSASSTPAERLRIHSSGETTMHVNSASHDTFKFTTQSSNEAKLIMKDASNNDDIVLNTGGNSWIIGGNLGVGTNSPVSPIHIVGTNGIKIDDSTNGKRADFRSKNDVIEINGYDPSNSNAAVPIVLKQYTNERLRIDSNGKIVTGGGTAVGKLTLAGDGEDITFGRTQNSGTGGVGRLVASGNIVYLQAGENTSSGSAADLVLGNYGGVGERLRIDSSGRNLIGGQTASEGSHSNLQVREDGYGRNVEIFRSYNTGTTPARIRFSNSRGTAASPAIVANGDMLAEIRFNGYDGTNYDTQAAKILASVDGTPGENDMPGRLAFFTTADGGVNPTERMRITSTGLVGINMTPGTDASSTYMLQMYNSGAQCFMSIGNGTSGSGPNNGLIVGNDANNAYVWNREATALQFGTGDTEKLRIASNGAFGIGGANYGSSGQVLTSNGSGSAPTWQDAGGGGGGVSSDSEENTVGGSNAGNALDADTYRNTLFGFDTGKLIDSGDDNTLMGWKTGDAITSGYKNTAFGSEALPNATSGNRNVAIGWEAGRSLTDGNRNVAIGDMAGRSWGSATQCIAIGEHSGANFGSGSNVIAIGGDSGFLGGTDTICIGRASGQRSNTGSVSVGYDAGRNVVGNYNISIGYQAQRARWYSPYATGEGNIAIGYRTCYSIETGGENTCVGYRVAETLTTGSNNTVIGSDAEPSSGSVSNEITLGDSSISTLRCQVTSITSLSDMRDKKDVVTLDAGIDFIKDLKPVKFTWNSREGMQKDGTTEAGFIAQDLEKVQKDHDSEYLRLVYDSNPDRLEASPGNLIPVMVKALQEATARIEALEEEVAALKGS